MAEGIALTGYGLVTAAGVGVAAFEEALARGETCLGPLDEAVAGGLPMTLGGRFPAGVFPEETGRVPAAARLATEEALDLAGALPRARTGVALGTGLGDTEAFEQFQRAPGDLAALWALSPAQLTHDLAEALGLGGPRAAFSVTCVSAVCALEQVRADLLLRRADAMVCVGVEGLTRTIQGGFCALDALSRSWAPGQPSPHDGILLGEAACALVLERASDADRRGAPTLGVVLGQGLVADATHMTTPDPSGRGMAAAIEQALSEARLAPADVSWVTLTADASPGYAEVYANALDATIAGDWRERTVSWEPIVGHVLAASGPLGLLHGARLLAQRPGAVLLLTVGFGGLNGATILGRSA